MKKIVLIVFAILLLQSCSQNSQKIESNFDENISITILFDEQQFEKLKNDEDFREYAVDYWEVAEKIGDVLSHSTAMVGMSNIIEDEKEGIKSKAGAALSIAGAIGSMTVGGLQALNLERKKNDMYASFSNEKIEEAKSFEKEIKKILQESALSYENTNVKKKDMLQNYKSFTAVIKEDDELFEQLDELGDDVDDLFSLGFTLRTKLMFNLRKDPSLDFAYISSAGQNVLSDPNTDVETESKILDSYFSQLQSICKKVQEVKTQKFSVPIEDWSIQKRENFNFIVSDIEIKLKQEVSALAIKKLKNKIAINIKNKAQAGSANPTQIHD